MSQVNPLSDGQIAKIVRTANNGEIEQARLAEKHSRNPEVRKFARMMIRQHTDVNSKLTRVSRNDKIEPKDSTPAAEIKQQGDQTLSSLKSLKGADFDRAYVNAQVKAHRDVLDSIDQKLLPNAKDPQLHTMLQQTRPAVQTHLNHAVQLQAKLLKGGRSKSTGQG
jgi:putative membrane protein